MSTVEQQPRHTSSESQRARGSHRRGRGRGNTRQNQATTRPVDSQNQGDQPEPTSAVPRSTRARNFGAQLSSSTQTQSPNTSVQTTDDKQVPKRHVKVHKHGISDTAQPSSTRLDSNINLPDLTARLMETLKGPPYADCVICWSAIHPTQPTWSCTVSEESNRCCWGVFHNKCIVAWSKKSERLCI
jgi:transcriptional repressor NF-X1